MWRHSRYMVGPPLLASQRVSESASQLKAGQRKAGQLRSGQRFMARLRTAWRKRLRLSCGDPLFPELARARA